MEQATMNSLLVILVLFTIMIGMGAMMWWRYKPSTRPAPSPGTPRPALGLSGHLWFWPVVIATVIVTLGSGIAIYYYGPLAILIIAALAVAAYGGYKGGGRGSVIFTYIAGTLLIIVSLVVLLFGFNGAGRFYAKLQDGANRVVEDGVSGWWSSGTAPETERSTARSYDLLVPASGCSDPIENTNPNFWVDPRPKNPSTGWPKTTQMVTPATGKGWVPYKTGATYSHLRYCDNGSEMWMTISFYRGRM